MWGVFNEFGQVADFDTKEEAEQLANAENEYEPNSHWVLYVSMLGNGGYPRG